MKRGRRRSPKVIGLLGQLGGPVAGTFRCMEVAEQEIAKRGLEADGTCFMLVMPTPGLVCRDERLYRAHAAELLDRRLKGEDETLGTKAEAIVALSEASLETPPSQQMAALYERLFVEVFGKPPWLEGRTPEPWKGASDELLAALRRKLRRAR